MIPMYRLWLHSLYGLHGPRWPLSPKRLLNLITHSLLLFLFITSIKCYQRIIYHGHLFLCFCSSLLWNVISGSFTMAISSSVSIHHFYEMLSADHLPWPSLPLFLFISSMKCYQRIIYHGHLFLCFYSSLLWNVISGSFTMAISSSVSVHHFYEMLSADHLPWPSLPLFLFITSMKCYQRIIYHGHLFLCFCSSLLWNVISGSFTMAISSSVSVHLFYEMLSADHLPWPSLPLFLFITSMKCYQRIIYHGHLFICFCSSLLWNVISGSFTMAISSSVSVHLFYEMLSADHLPWPSLPLFLFISSMKCYQRIIYHGHLFLCFCSSLLWNVISESFTMAISSSVSVHLFYEMLSADHLPWPSLPLFLFISSMKCYQRIIYHGHLFLCFCSSLLWNVISGSFTMAISSSVSVHHFYEMLSADHLPWPSLHLFLFITSMKCYQRIIYHGHLFLCFCSSLLWNVISGSFTMAISSSVSVHLFYEMLSADHLPWPSLPLFLFISSMKCYQRIIYHGHLILCFCSSLLWNVISGSFTMAISSSVSVHHFYEMLSADHLPWPSLPQFLFFNSFFLEVNCSL